MNLYTVTYSVSSAYLAAHHQSTGSASAWSLAQQLAGHFRQEGIDAREVAVRVNIAGDRIDQLTIRSQPHNVDLETLADMIWNKVEIVW